MVLAVAGCSGEISREEFRERSEELQADLFAGGGGETIREARELAARPPDRALRDSAEALVGEIDGLFDEVIAVRKEIRELTVPEAEDADRARERLRFGLRRRDQVQEAADAVESAEQERAGTTWQEIQAELEGETIEAVDNGMRRGAAEKRRLEGALESGRATLGRLEEEAAERESSGNGCTRSAAGHRARAGAKAEPGVRASTGSGTRDGGGGTGARTGSGAGRADAGGDSRGGGCGGGRAWSHSTTSSS